MRKTLFGAIEAGGTKFVCEVVNTNNTIVATTRIPTSNPADTLKEVIAFFAQQETSSDGYAAFGIAAFGPLDLQFGSPNYGAILNTPKKGWSQTNMLTPFVQRFRCPVAIDTDVNAAALAEEHKDGSSPVVYITVGTGIGGGVCISGDTLQGNLHPEMGHIPVLRHELDQDFAGICPFHGDCLEGLASGAAIKERWGTSLECLGENHEAFQIVGSYLGQLAVNVILLLSPKRVIFGGGVMSNYTLITEIRQTVLNLLNGYAGLGGSKSALNELIVLPGLGERSGIEGALLLAKKINLRDSK